jgi:hypothetical protein
MEAVPIPAAGTKRAVIDAIRRQLDEARVSHIYRDYSNALKLISQVVFTRASGFVLEFLQNAEDSGLGLECAGAFRLNINERRLKVSHNGRPFTENDVASLCGIRSSKRPEKGSLGYLGIGFKSVFKVSDRPEVYSGGFRLKFEKPSDSPDSLWQVMPIWIDEPSEPVGDDFTTFIVPFRDPGTYALLRGEFSRLGPQVYLFLRWIRSITILDEPSGAERRLANAGTDEHGVTALKDNDREQRFRVFRAAVEVPPHVRSDTLTQDYRAGVTRREIVIGFALDHTGKLAPSEAMASYGGVYSFLPLGESKSGAAFPIQADFLVQPGRDAINYEAPWNHWLVDEVAELCRKAIAAFVAHATWRYQFLPMFTFSHSRGNEAYDKLFGPHLIEPVERFLNAEPCIPTADDSLAPLSKLARLTEDQAASSDVVSSGVLARAEMATALGGGPDTLLVHPLVVESPAKPIRPVNRWGLLSNEEFLHAKAVGPNAPAWFRVLYQWLRKHPEFSPGRKKQLRTYHQAEFVLAVDGRLLAGRELSLVDDLPQSNQLLLEIAKRWQEGRPILHPDILAGAATEVERKDVRGFLIGLTGVQQISAADLCRQAVVPMIATSAPKPSVSDLLPYTRCCHEVFGKEPGDLPELWVLTKAGEIRAAKEVFFSSEFKPQPDWEKHKQYVPGLNFLSPKYLDGAREDVLPAWRALFRAGGVKPDPDDGVEVFAVHFAEEQLRLRHAAVTRIEEHNFGYDLEVKTQTGESLQIEVKGRQKEEDIELTPNESDAARKNQDTYFLCVVTPIPERPAMYMVRNPDRVGVKEKLTIPAAVWREERLV